MIRFVFIIAFCLCVQNLHAQDLPPTTEQQLENLTDVDQAETEDDSYLQQLEQFRKNPIDLNTATADDLKELIFLTDLQIHNLIAYRNLLGKFISMYELQAVPAWDVATIKKVLPFVTISNAVSVKEEFRNRFKKGDNIFLLRASRVLEKSIGFDKSISGTKYAGSANKFFFRYRYQYKNLLQYGITGDKDAGEQFLKGKQKAGFDFYSMHLFVRNIGKIKALALGDFTVNMGQGLMLWQSLAFKKSVDVMGIKRQSTVLRPYNSGGEFYFNRGAGVTMQFGKLEATAFASIRKLSGNFVADTISNEDYISSLLNSGYHRTVSENADRNNVQLFSTGGVVKLKSNNWQVGVNAVYYHFSLPVQKSNEPYNLFAFNGNQWMNMSVDYSYTFKNMHFFGEAAMDKNFNTAFVNGLLVSADSRVDFSLLQRTISKKYQALFGNAFTENTLPANETGYYAGISLRPFAGIRLDAYSDIYSFPWLKYLVDAPSSGKDFLIQLTYTPNKQTELYARFRNETKQSDFSDNTTVTNFLTTIPKKNWRMQLTWKMSTDLSFRNRYEFVWYNTKAAALEKGFLTFFDVLYKPVLKPYGATLRLQYFETDSYNARLYAYENDVLYSYSIPVFYDKGIRYYINYNYDVNRKLSLWFRIAQTVYKNQESIGSGLDVINGSHKTEIKLQLRFIF